MGFDMEKIDVFKDLGITKYINAHDTYTVYGGSRMDDIAIEAMNQIGRMMPTSLKETSEAGLAVTKTGKELTAKIFAV